MHTLCTFKSVSKILIFLTPFLVNTIKLFVHSNTRNGPYQHTRLDSILEWCRTLSNDNYVFLILIHSKACNSINSQLSIKTLDFCTFALHNALINNIASYVRLVRDVSVCYSTVPISSINRNYLNKLEF